MATSVTPATVSKTTTAKGCNWNELSYYLSLERAGLTRPLQFGSDPVTSPNHGSQNVPLCTGLQLYNSQPWGPGPFSAPAKTVTSPVSTPPPPPSVFGAIGKALTCGTNQLAEPIDSKELSKSDSSVFAVASTNDSDSGASNAGGYSLFDGTGQSLFGSSFLSGQLEVQQSVTEKIVGKPLTSSNEGVAPQSKDEAKNEKFDEWPAL